MGIIVFDELKRRTITKHVTLIMGKQDIYLGDRIECVFVDSGLYIEHYQERQPIAKDALCICIAALRGRDDTTPMLSKAYRIASIVAEIMVWGSDRMNSCPPYLPVASPDYMYSFSEAGAGKWPRHAIIEAFKNAAREVGIEDVKDFAVERMQCSNTHIVNLLIENGYGERIVCGKSVRAYFPKTLVDRATKLLAGAARSAKENDEYKKGRKMIKEIKRIELEQLRLDYETDRSRLLAARNAELQELEERILSILPN